MPRGKSGGVPAGESSLERARYPEKYKAGDRSMLIEPLDWKLLELMPDFDTNVAGMYQIGSNSVFLAKQLNIGLSPTQVATRVRVLHILGFCHIVKTLGSMGTKSGASWQKTKQGEEELKKWEAQQS